MARKSRIIVGNMMELPFKLPWWLGLIAALVFYLGSYWYVAEFLPAGTTTGDLNVLLVSTQYVVPAIFLCGLLLSIIRSSKRKGLYDKMCQSKSPLPFDKLSWYDFEYLVGDYYRRRYFDIEKNKGHASDGVDLRAKKGRETYFIQCNHYKAKEVGTKLIKQLLDSMAAAKVTGGVVITSGNFAMDASALARAHKIEIMNGGEFHNNMKTGYQPERPSLFQKIKWAMIVLLVAGIGYFAFFPEKTGDSGRASKGKVLEFSENQVEKAMKDTLEEKKAE